MTCLISDLDFSIRPDELFDEAPKPRRKCVPKYRTDPKTGQQIRIN